MHHGALDARICGLRIERGDLTALRQVPHAELGVRCKSEQRGAIRSQSVLAHFADIKGQASRGDFVARRDIPGAHPDGGCSGAFLRRLEAHVRKSGPRHRRCTPDGLPVRREGEVARPRSRHPRW